MKFKLEVLTPVHIGSGEELLPNYNYLKTANHLIVLDYDKILSMIDGKESVVRDWVNQLDGNKSLWNWLNQVNRGGPALDSEQLGKRAITFDAKEDEDWHAKRTIKEQMHDGLGRCTIPGSSLKGALRNAYLADRIARTSYFAEDTDNFMVRHRYDDTLLQAFYMRGGKNMNEDIFRLLRVGDVLFEGSVTVCYVNKRYNIESTDDDRYYEDFSYLDWFLADRLIHYAEYIEPGATSILDIRMDEHLKEKQNSFMRAFPESMKTQINEFTLPEVLSIHHQHARALLQRQINFLSGYNIYEGLPQFFEGPADDIFLYMQELLNKFDACDLEKGEYILRVGKGQGFAGITGGWMFDETQEIDENILEETEWRNLIKEVRDRPKKKKYEDLPFPKSFELADGKYPTGFVKISPL